MHRLLYTSTTVRSVQGLTMSGQARLIASQSQRRNGSAGITGVLVQVDDQFIQVLEGRIEEVEKVFEAICCDFRHSNVRLIDLVPITERMFEGWQMACLAAGEATEVNLRRELRDVQFMVGVNAREAVSQLRGLLEREKSNRARAA